MKFATSQCFAWTDSSIVLSWLRRHPTRWKTYIANRIVAIHSNVNQAIWQHVRSEDNPADVPSRSVNPTDLLSHGLWWNGPKWLLEPENIWPISQPTLDTDLEGRAVLVSVNNIVQLGTLLEDC